MTRMCENGSNEKAKAEKCHEDDEEGTRGYRMRLNDCISSHCIHPFSPSRTAFQEITHE